MLAAAVTGYLGGRSGLAAFAPGGGHGAAGGQPVADAATILGEAAPTRDRRGKRRLFLTASLLLIAWLGPVAVLWAVLGGDHVFAEIAFFFSKMAVVTFGGAYAVLAWVAQAGVETYGWLQPGEMLDGLGNGGDDARPAHHGDPVSSASWRRGANRACWRPCPPACSAGALTTWVTFAPCFPVDLPVCALRRTAARTQGPVGRLDRDYRRRGRGRA